MKKTMIAFYITIFIGHITYAQYVEKVVSNDSLFKMFQTMKPFEVFYKVEFKWFDFKACYNDTLLKPYLMKWLDRDEYFQYTIEVEKQNLSNRPDWIKDKIGYQLNKQGKIKILDSILMNPQLYALYHDSVMTISTKEYIEQNKGKISVPSQAIVLHSFFAYPESYTIIKQWWEESGRQTERGRLFFALVRMGDPDARKLFDEKIKYFVKSNGESSDLPEIYGELIQYNSYCRMKMLEVLNVDVNYIRLSEGDSGTPFNCEVIRFLIAELLKKDIKLSPSLQQSKTCKEQRRHLFEIKSATKKLMKKYEAEEYYWMKNMPFYKGK